MNRNFSIIFAFITIAMAIPGKAQDNDKPLNISQYFDAPLIGRSYKAPPRGKGSPYLYDNWLTGYVVLTSGDTVKNRLFKFDCFKNEFVWMADGKSLIALDHNLIKGFALFPQYGVAMRNFEKTSLKLPFLADTTIRYLEVLSAGHVNLYAYRKVTAYTESTTGAASGLYQVNSYESEPVFFIQAGNLPVKQVGFFKKSIINAYPEYSLRLKKILKENHYGGIRNEYQLTTAIKLINENW